MPRDAAITSRIMAAVRSRDTQPELMLRRELHRRGLRYRLRSDLIGRPDIIFPRARVAVFVDGAFWHGYGWQERGFDSWQSQFDNHANPEKWRAKIGRNIERDAEVNVALASRGWHVCRILESAVRSDVIQAADEVEAAVRMSTQHTAR